MVQIVRRARRRQLAGVGSETAAVDQDVQRRLLLVLVEGDLPRPVPKLGPAGINERTAPLEIRRNSSTRTGYAAATNT